MMPLVVKDIVYSGVGDFFTWPKLRSDPCHHKTLLLGIRDTKSEGGRYITISLSGNALTNIADLKV